MATNRKIEVMDVLVALVLSIMAIPIFILFNGFIIMKLWLWFIVPLGVPILTIWHAFGIASFVNFFKYGLSTKYDVKQMDKDKSMAGNMLSLFCESLFFGIIILTISYVFHRMMI